MLSELNTWLFYFFSQFLDNFPLFQLFFLLTEREVYWVSFKALPSFNYFFSWFVFFSCSEHLNKNLQYTHSNLVPFPSAKVLVPKALTWCLRAFLLQLLPERFSAFFCFSGSTVCL